MIIGYTTGVFDLFHIGHLNILRKSKEQCDFLIVGVATDDLVYSLKKKRPVVPYLERAEIVENIKYVDKVIAQEKIDELFDFQKYRFNKIFKGSDWCGSEKWIILEKEFSRYNVEVIFFDYTKTTSSTLIRKALETLFEC